MRTLTFVGMLGLVAALGCDTGLAPDPSPLGSTLDPDGNAVAGFSALPSVSGSGHVRRSDGGLRKFTVNATQHADGSVSGQYDLELVPIELLKEFDVHPPILGAHGTITCMKVVGNVAYLGGVVDHQTNAALFLGTDDLTGVAIEVRDNGNGNVPGGTADEISSVAFYFPGSPGTPQDYCDNPTPGPVFPIEQGNITVR